jgi:hypothetical protein
LIYENRADPEEKEVKGRAGFGACDCSSSPVLPAAHCAEYGAQTF